MADRFRQGDLSQINTETVSSPLGLQQEQTLDVQLKSPARSFADFWVSPRVIKKGKLQTLSNTQLKVTKRGQLLWLPPGDRLAISASRDSAKQLLLLITLWAAQDGQAFVKQAFTLARSDSPESQRTLIYQNRTLETQLILLKSIPESLNVQIAQSKTPQAFSDALLFKEIDFKTAQTQRWIQLPDRTPTTFLALSPEHPITVSVKGPTTLKLSHAIPFNARDTKNRFDYRVQWRLNDDPLNQWIFLARIDTLHRYKKITHAGGPHDIMASHWQPAFLKIPPGHHTLTLQADRRLWIKVARTPARWANRLNAPPTKTTPFDWVERQVKYFNTLQSVWQTALGQSKHATDSTELLNFIHQLSPVYKGAQDYQILQRLRIDWGLKSNKYSHFKHLTPVKLLSKHQKNNIPYRQYTFSTYTRSVPKPDNRIWPKAPKHLFQPIFNAQYHQTRPHTFYKLTASDHWSMRLPTRKSPSEIRLNLVSNREKNQCVFDAIFKHRDAREERHQIEFNTLHANPFSPSPLQAADLLVSQENDALSAAAKGAVRHTLTLPLAVGYDQFELHATADCQGLYFYAEMSVPRRIRPDEHSLTQALTTQHLDLHAILHSSGTDLDSGHCAISDAFIRANFADVRESLNAEVWTTALSLAAPSQSAWLSLRFKSAFTQQQRDRFPDLEVTETHRENHQIAKTARQLLTQGDWYMAEQLWEGLFWFSTDSALIKESLETLTQQYKAKNDYNKLKKLLWLHWHATKELATLKDFLTVLYQSDDYKNQRALMPLFYALHPDNVPSKVDRLERISIQASQHGGPITFAYLPTGTITTFETATPEVSWQAALTPNTVYKLAVRPLHDPTESTKSEDFKVSKSGRVTLNRNDLTIQKRYFNNKVSMNYAHIPPAMAQTSTVDAANGIHAEPTWQLGTETAWRLETGAQAETITLNAIASPVAVSLTTVRSEQHAASQPPRSKSTRPITMTRGSPDLNERPTSRLRQAVNDELHSHWLRVPTSGHDSGNLEGKHSGDLRNLAEFSNLTSLQNTHHKKGAPLAPQLSSEQNDPKHVQRQWLAEWTERLRAKEDLRKQALLPLLSGNFLNAGQAHLNDIVRQLSGQWRWRPYNDIIQNEGFKLIESQIPDAPNLAARLRLIETDDQAQLVFGDTPTALEFMFQSPTLLRVTLKQSTYPFRPQEKRQVSIQSSAGSQQREIWLTDNGSTTVTIPFPAGRHWVKITQTVAVGSAPLSIRYEKRSHHSNSDSNENNTTENSPSWQTLETKSLKRFYLSTNENSLFVYNRVPTIARIDIWDDLSDLSNRHSHYQTLKGGKLERLAVPKSKGSRTSPRYIRVYLPEIISDKDITPHHYTLSRLRFEPSATNISDAMTTEHQALRTPKAVSENQRFLTPVIAPGLTSNSYNKQWYQMGVLETGLSWQTISTANQEEERSRDADASQQITAHIGFRQRLNTDNIFYRTNLRILDVDNENSSLESNHWLTTSPSHLPYDWETQLSLRASQVKSIWFGSAHLFSKLSYQYPINTFWRNRSTFALRFIGMPFDTKHARTAAGLSRRVFSEYKSNHRVGLEVSNQFTYTPYTDMQFIARWGLLNNASANPFDLDRAQMDLGLFHYYNGLIGSAALTHTQYLSDDHRPLRFDRTRMTVKLDHQSRWNDHARLKTSFFMAYDTVRDETEFGLSFTFYLDQNSHFYHHDTRGQRFRALYRERFIHETLDHLRSGKYYE